MKNPYSSTFGLSEDVSVNAIVGKTTLKEWRSNIDFDEGFLVGKQQNTKFSPKYRITNSGMPVNTKLNSKYFVGTPKLIQ